MYESNSNCWMDGCEGRQVAMGVCKDHIPAFKDHMAREFAHVVPFGYKPKSFSLMMVQVEAVLLLSTIPDEKLAAMDVIDVVNYCFFPEVV